MSRMLQVNLDAVQHNMTVLRATAPAAQAMAVVKADGYGHGASDVARASVEAGAEWLGVADISEALALRDFGLDVPILAWLHPDTRRFSEAVAHSVTLGVSTLGQLEAAARAAQEVRHPAVVHIKVETGLHRNGFDDDRLADAFNLARHMESRGLVRIEGIFSHLANASESADRAALDRFHSAVSLARAARLEPRLRHVAATAAGFFRPDTHLDLVRWGIGLYGVAPDDGDPRDLSLRPALTMCTRVVATRTVRAGEGISYNYADIAESDLRTALVPVGYADGIPRLASPGAWVSIGGVRCSVRGRIAMDQMVVECPPSVREGDQVTIFGDPTMGAPSVSEWAKSAGTIGYDVIARLPRPGGRLTRRAAHYNHVGASAADRIIAGHGVST